MRKTGFPIPSVFLFFAILICAALACNLPINNRQEGLTINTNTNDGSVSGTYRTGNQSIIFSVSSDGVATFQAGKGADIEKLIVDMRDETKTAINWQGAIIDGLGELSSEEVQSLNDLVVSQVAPGLDIIPIDAGCLGEEIINDKQLAALLFPLQMQFKYQISDRTSKAIELMQLSQCFYGALEGEMAENNFKNSSSILLSPSNPIPVVLGYFPFDEVGAMASSVSLESGDSFVCLDPWPFVNLQGENIQPLLPVLELNGPTPILDEFGPCKATCRGACGPDCTTNNCEYSSEFRCEKDQAGNNTGLVSIVHIYDCGVHPACIAHDHCYDQCNQRFGCGSWDATYCRHGGWGLTEEYMTQFNELYGIEMFCDKITVTDENFSDVRGWVKGYGPQPLSQVYEYTDEIARDMAGQKECPPPSTNVQEEPPPPAPEPPKDPAPVEKPPASIEPQLVTAVSPPIWNCGGVILRFTIEFWNVGAQGGEEYSMLDFYGNGCNHDVVTEETHWYGTFEGGPNGKFTFYDIFYDDVYLDCSLVDGEVVQCAGFVIFDEVLTLPFEVLNPEAFDDWK